MDSLYPIKGVSDEEFTTFIKCMIRMTTEGLQSLLPAPPAETVNHSQSIPPIDIQSPLIENMNEVEDPSINGQDFSVQVPRELFTETNISVPPSQNANYYPNGNTTFTLPKVAAFNSTKAIPPTFGWKFLTYNSKKMSTGFFRTYKYCLGVYQCPNCKFKQAPRQEKDKKKFGPPREPKVHCPQHPSQQLQYMTCKCLLTVTEQSDFWDIHYTGEHLHPMPPCNGKLDAVAFKKFESLVLSAPEATPIQLKVGGPTRGTVSILHKGLQNLDTIWYQRKKILKETGMKSSLADLINISKHMDKKFLRKFSLTDTNPHIVMQDEDMVEILKKGESPLQTDSVEGFLYEPNLKHGQQPNITFTSGYDSTIGRWAPLCISILFGKSKADYMIHWEQVLSCFCFESWDEFEMGFPGNTSDFSDALRLSFFDAVKLKARQEYSEVVDDSRVILLYKFCMVHFQRSRCRISQNRKMVPSDKEDEFVDIVNHLCQLPTGKFLEFKNQCKKFMKAFPLAEGWLKWYLNPDRATILFPACQGKRKNDIMKELSADTNAQENMGRQFQCSTTKQKLGIAEAILHAYKFCKMWELDRKAKAEGMSISYSGKNTGGQAKKKRKVSKWTNDGRAPDTTDKLEDFKKQKRFEGIAWSFCIKTKGLNVTNTCRLDSVLTVLFYLEESGMLNCKSLIEGLTPDHPICQSFEWLTKGKDAGV